MQLLEVPFGHGDGRGDDGSRGGRGAALGGGASARARPSIRDRGGWSSFRSSGAAVGAARAAAAAVVCGADRVLLREHSVRVRGCRCSSGAIGAAEQGGLRGFDGVLEFGDGRRDVSGGNATGSRDGGSRDLAKHRAHVTAKGGAKGGSSVWVKDLTLRGFAWACARASARGYRRPRGSGWCDRGGHRWRGAGELAR